MTVRAADGIRRNIFPIVDAYRLFEGISRRFRDKTAQQRKAISLQIKRRFGAIIPVHKEAGAGTDDLSLRIDSACARGAGEFLAGIQVCHRPVSVAESVLGEMNRIRRTDDPSLVIDGIGFALQSSQRAQIAQLTVFPNKRVPGAMPLYPPDYLSPIIDGGRLAALAFQRAQIPHAAALPEKRMALALSRLGPPDHITLFVDCPGLALSSPQRAQVAHPALLPEKCMRNIVSRVGGSDSLPRCIDPGRVASMAAKRPQFRRGAILPQNSLYRNTGRGTPARDLLPVVER